MRPAKAPQFPISAWLEKHGPAQLEELLREIVFHVSLPVLIADQAGHCKDASVGIARLLQTSRRTMLGRPLGAFATPVDDESNPIPLPPRADEEGRTRLTLATGTELDVEYLVKTEVLPERHLLVLRDNSSAGGEEKLARPPWVPDYALSVLRTDGRIALWYAGSTRLYGYRAHEVIGRPLSFLNLPEEAGLAELELRKAAKEGQSVHEGWQLAGDGERRFWANMITVALHSEDGTLQGFGRLVRDFTGRHQYEEEQLRRSRARLRPASAYSTIVGMISGVFDEVPEVNDAFLSLVGYTREEMVSGVVTWPELTPLEYAPLDEFAHEESLRFRACTPYEKELIAKDGTRVPVLITTAMLPLSRSRWITLVQDLRDRNRIEILDDDVGHPVGNFAEIVGSSGALRRVQRLIEVVAPTDANVLILGETGTGKELVARAVHQISHRRPMPFVTLNCAAIPTGLLESELFGYERGAFTGALSQKIGRFEMAHRGTLFLDEVGDIPLDLQPKLLRALQEKAFERLGGTKTIPIDVRLVAATNRDLAQMIEDKLFRSDLYYRLRVFPIETPPLRERPEDVPVLARHFTKKYAAKMGREIDSIPAETMRALVSWPWPGNVRELENFIERSVILSRGPALRAPLSELRLDSLPAATEDTLEQVERDHILRVLRESGGVVTKAATRLGLHRTTLNAMMRRLGISRKDI